jgi:hypothetical protein
MKRNVNMNLDRKLVEKLKKIAAETGRTFSGLVEIILREYLNGRRI